MKKYILQKLIPKSIGFYLNTVAVFHQKHAGKKALEIFGKPRSGQLREKDITFLASFTTQDFFYDGKKIMTYHKGKGAITIMLCHGWESNAARWKHFIQYLETTMDCSFVLMDAPAHGGSEGVFFDSIQYAHSLRIVAQHYKPQIIIGHSIGAGSIAFCMSNIEQLSVHKMVLMGSPNSFDDILDNYFKIISLRKKGRAAMRSVIKEQYKMSASDYNVSNYAKSILCKCLVVHDEDDDVTSINNAKAIHQNLPNGELVITKGFGHSLQGKEVFEIVKNFIV